MAEDAVDQRIIIARLNIEHFRKQLVTEKDETRRQMLLRLLAEEEAKLAALDRMADKSAMNLVQALEASKTTTLRTP